MLALPLLAEEVGEADLQLDQCHLLVRKIEETLRVADFPACPPKAIDLGLLHGGGKRGCFDLAVEPHEGFIRGLHTR